jgi:hypothetical protein
LKELLSNFSKGEFAPALYGRVDVPQYNAGLRRGRNFVLERYGGAQFRPGFRLVYEVDAEKQHEPIPFQFSIDQAYVPVLTDAKLYALANGGVLVENNLKITAITKAATAVLTIPFHAYAVGRQIFISGVEGMTEINFRYAQVLEVIDENTIRVDIDTRDFGDFVDSDGTERTAAPAPPPEPEAPPPPPPDPVEPPTTGTGGGSGWMIGGGKGITSGYEVEP